MIAKSGGLARDQLNNTPPEGSFRLTSHKEIIMKRVLIAGVALAACASLSACASLGNLTQSGGIGEKVLQNLEGCDREYSGALGAGVTGSFRITCKATQAAPAAGATVQPPPGGT